MHEAEPYSIFTRKLEEAGVRYMVSGSVAAIYYGEPRMTNDVDIILFLEEKDVPLLVKTFPLEEFYCPPEEVIEVELRRDQHGHFNLIHHGTGFKADIYLTRRDPLHAWGADRMVKAEIDGETIAFAPPEYVIVRKLQYYREGGAEKHVRDIRRMLTGLGEEWSRSDLEEWIQRFRLEPEWSQVTQGID